MPGVFALSPFTRACATLADQEARFPGPGIMNPTMENHHGTNHHVSFIGKSSYIIIFIKINQISIIMLVIYFYELSMGCFHMPPPPIRFASGPHTA
jgi:hypothetical protein